MTWRKQIDIDPAVCHGRACITGTRILVSAILDNLADGLEVPEVARLYPGLKESQVLAAVAYAADLACGRSV